MKIEIKTYSNISSLISAIVFLIIGALLFTNPGGVVKFISYIIGTIIIIIGLFNLLKYFSLKKQNIIINSFLVTSIICLVIGFLAIICSGAVETSIRYIMGAWILFSGINRLILSLNLMNQKFPYLAILILSIAMILCGLYIILKTNLVFKMIGLFIMIYSIFEIVGYILYSKNDKNIIIK